MPGKHAQVNHAMTRPRPRKALRISSRPLPSTFNRAVRQSLRGVLQDIWLDGILPMADKIAFTVRDYRLGAKGLPGRAWSELRSSLLRFTSRLTSGLASLLPTWGNRDHVVFKIWTGASAMLTFVSASTPASAAGVIETPLWSTASIAIQTLSVPRGFATVINRDQYTVVEYYAYRGKGNPYFKGWAAEGSPSVEDLVSKNRNTPYDQFDAAMLSLRAIGIPYVFGGDSPFGFDCSGFVRHVYAHFGISLPHSVTGIDAIGKRIPASKATAGDLVIWNDYSHMGIYMGDNMLVHAPRPGSQVEYRDLWDSNVHFVRITK